MGSPIAPLIPKGAYYRAIRKIEEFIEPFIARAIALPESELEELSKSDMQFTFLHSIARFSKDPKTIRDQVMSALLAGRDTTAATMSWAMYEISNYPAAWARLRSEVLDVLGPNEKPTYEALKNLKYARYVLNETLRLHPAVPMNMRQALETTTIPGAPGERDIVLLKGDTVTINTLGMHARRDLYPPVTETFADPAIFSPERWESWTPKPWTYLPFHGGLRICIGQNFALTEMAYCCEYPRGHDWILPQSLVMLMSGRQWFALRSVMSGSSTAAIGRHSHYGQTSLGSRLSGCRLRCLSLCCRVTMMSESYHKRRRDTNSKTRTDNPRYARKSPLPLAVLAQAQAIHGVPNTLPLSSNRMPSPLSSPLFSSSVMPSPSRGHLPLKPPSVMPVATTRWHGTPGAKGLRRSALPTARGEEPRCADSRP